MAQSRLLTTAFLALSLSVAGCAGIQTTEAPIAKDAQDGAIGYFESERASLTIHVIDERPYATQSIHFADDFNGLLFRLTNEAKLKTPMLKAVAKDGNTYSLAFTNLPSDAQARYALTVGAYRNVTTPTDASDSAFTLLDNKVAEGFSANFSLEPGANKSLTITMNAVGDVSFTSNQFWIDSTTPFFLSGATDIVLSSLRVNSPANPEAEELRAYFKDASGNLVADTTATASIPAIGNATVSLKVPTVSGASQNFSLVTDLATGSDTVLSRRTRTVTVEPAASINLDIGGGER